MKRRSILSLTGGAAIYSALPSFAQTPRVMRVGRLVVPPATHPLFMELEKNFRDGMKRLGWEVGRNLSVDTRGGQSDPALHYANAMALVESKVDLITATGGHPLVAALRATRTVPIIVFGFNSDPVQAGYAKSLSRPGGNVTGSTQSAATPNKWLEMMRAVRPGLVRVGFTSLNSAPGVGSGVPSIQTAARRLGLQIVILPDLRDIAGIDLMLEAAKKEGIQGLLLGGQTFLKGEGARRIQAWATENNVLTGASSYFAGEFLITHGPNFPALLDIYFKQVDQVLRGGKPAEMPIEEPMVFDIVISRKIAKAMGLTLPQSVLLQATEVID